MFLLPGFESLLAEEHRYRRRRFAVRRHVEYVFGSLCSVAFRRTLALVEVLVNVTAFGRIRFLPPNLWSAGERSLLLSKPVEHADFTLSLFRCSLPRPPDWAPRALRARRAGCSPSGSRRKKRRSTGSN